MEKAQVTPVLTGDPDHTQCKKLGTLFSSFPSRDPALALLSKER